MTKATLIGDATQAGIGVKAYCVSRNGLGMETEYITFNRPKVTAIKMTKGPYMFETFLGSWTFKEIENQKTEVVFLYSFTLSFPFNLFKYVIKYILMNNVKQRLKDLKKCIENNGGL